MKHIWTLHLACVSARHQLVQNIPIRKVAQRHQGGAVHAGGVAPDGARHVRAVVHRTRRTTAVLRQQLSVLQPAALEVDGSAQHRRRLSVESQLQSVVVDLRRLVVEQRPPEWSDIRDFPGEAIYSKCVVFRYNIFKLISSKFIFVNFSN